MWLGTNHGLYKYALDGEKTRFYTDKDGLQSNQFSIKAGYKDSKGNLYFGGINGFNKFDPEKIEFNRHIPKIAITELKLFHLPVTYKSHPRILKKSINYADEITLSYKDYLIGFTFASMNYINTEQNKYTYKLFGFDKRWNYLKQTVRHTIPISHQVLIHLL